MDTLVQVVINGLILGGLYALLSQGLAIIFGVMRVINLAHGELFLVGAYLAWFLHEQISADPFLLTPLIGLIGFGVGWLICRLIIMPVVERPPLMALLVTFGLAAVTSTTLVFFFTTTPRFTRVAYSTTVWTVLGYRLPVDRLIMLGVAVVFLALLWVFLRSTRAGKSMRAASQNKEAARIVGISIPNVYCGAFGLGTALVFVAGALFSSTQGFFPYMGPIFTLKAFAVIVLGGAGRIGGTLLAGILLGLLETGIASYVPGIGTGLGIAASFILVVAVLAIRPSGLLASPQLEEA